MRRTPRPIPRPLSDDEKAEELRRLDAAVSRRKTSAAAPLDTAPENAPETAPAIAPAVGAGFAQEIAAALAKITPRTDAELRAEHFRQFIAPALAAAGFSDRHRIDGILDGNDPRCAMQRDAIERAIRVFRGVGAIVVFDGPRGTGKTSLAAQIAIRFYREDLARYLAGKGAASRAVLYAKLTDIICRLKPLYADFGTVQSERLERYRETLLSADLLVIDELNEAPDEGRHKWAILSDILDKRYACRRDSLLITNETAASFAATANPSIVSRWREHGGAITCAWHSFRDRPATGPNFPAPIQNAPNPGFFSRQ